MKIGLFIPTYRRDYNKISASLWIRVLQMKAYYEMLGMTVSVNNPFQQYDIVILYRLPTKNMYRLLQLLKYISKRTYYDICVNYFELHEKTNEMQVMINNRIATEVDGIICSTEPLAKKAKKFNENIFIMDDPFDIKHFKYAKNEINWDNAIFGWSGISAKSIFLDKYQDRLSNNCILIADKKLDRTFNYTFYKWRYQSFPFLLLQIDIAFLPREFDDVYNIGHSSFKALTFAVQGIPIIANKLPSYKKLALYYDAICFLEDYDSIDLCIEELKTRDRSTYKVRSYYSCENQAFEIYKYFLKELDEN